MLYREKMAVCREIHTKHIKTLCGQNVEFVNVKLVVYNYLRFPHQNLVRISFLLPYMPHAQPITSFIWSTKYCLMTIQQIVKLLYVEFAPVSCYFPSLTSKYLCL